jgi:hypothetical protein
VKSHVRFFQLFLLLLSFHLLQSPTIAAAPSITGSFKITENTDLGAEVRITVELTFINPTSTAVTINKVGIRSLSATSQVVSVTHSLAIRSNSTSTVSLQFLLPKKDFTTWHSSPHQLFLVNLTPRGGKSTLINLPLLRTQG